MYLEEAMSAASPHGGDSSLTAPLPSPLPSAARLCHAENAAVVSLTQRTTRVACFLIFADAVQAACTGILKGAGKQVGQAGRQPSTRFASPCLVQ